MLNILVSGQKGNIAFLDHRAKMLQEIMPHKNCCFVFFLLCFLCGISLICAIFNCFGKCSCYLTSYWLKSNSSSWIYQKESWGFQAANIYKDALVKTFVHLFSKRNHNYLNIHCTQKSKKKKKKKRNPPVLLIQVVSKASQSSDKRIEVLLQWC